MDSEQQHLKEVLVSFIEYHKYMNYDIDRRWRHLCALSPEHVKKLPPAALNSKLHKERGAIDANQVFLELVVQYVGDVAPYPDVLNVAYGDLSRNEHEPFVLTSQGNMAKIRAALHSCLREWSKEGAEEREACFKPLLEELQNYLPVTPANRCKQCVLVPGAGLGRLPLEVASRGYACQGNEFSWYMLLTSNLLLNCTEKAEALTIHPWIDATCNVYNLGDNIRHICIPDICPSALLQLPDNGLPAEGGLTGEAGGQRQAESAQEAQEAAKKHGLNGTGPLTYPPFSMTAGEFQEVYGSQRDCWDCVITCFFLDTAPVIIEYIEVIHQILRPGGLWINLGPLLYHWAGGESGDARYQRSVELSWEEVRHVIVEGYGFEVRREERREMTYAMNRLSMMRTVYNVVFFSATKGRGGEERKVEERRGEEGHDRQ